MSRRACVGGCKGITYVQTCHVLHVYPIVVTVWIYSKGQDMGSDKGGDDKWDGIDPAGRGRAKVAGKREGAGKGSKGEAQRLKGITTQRARQAKQYLDSLNPSQVAHMLTGSSKTLTAKQRAYAYHVAHGATKAEAYRTAYKRDATKATIITAPYQLAANPIIAREIEAYKLAQEAAKHRTAEDLRSLVIQTLVQQVIDPDCPPAVRTQAAKTLGNVTEVAAFTERKESIVHHSSDKLRAQILEQVQALMQPRQVAGETIEQDAASLLDELAAPRQDTDGPSQQDHDTPKLSD